MNNILAIKQKNATEDMRNQSRNRLDVQKDRNISKLHQNITYSLEIRTRKFNFTFDKRIQ